MSRRLSRFEIHSAPHVGGRRQQFLHDHQDPLVCRRPPLGAFRFHPPIAAAASQPRGSSRSPRPPVGTVDNPPTPSGRRRAHSGASHPSRPPEHQPLSCNGTTGPPRSQAPIQQCSSLSSLTAGGVPSVGLLPLSRRACPPTSTVQLTPLARSGPGRDLRDKLRPPPSCRSFFPQPHGGGLQFAGG
jgi:hypothetical protein